MGAYRDRVIADGAVHYWRLNETSGTTAADLVGGASGAISGGVTLNQPGALADGSPSMSFVQGGGIFTPNESIVIPALCTFEAWCLAVAGTSRPIFSARSPSFLSLLLVIGSGAGGGATQFYANGNVIGVKPITDGQWHYVVCTNDGTNSRIYVDGVLDTTQALTFPSDTGQLTLGWDVSGSVSWLGSLQELAIYPRALTPAEVAAHYDLRLDTGVIVPEPPMFADTSAVEAAVIARLAADPALTALLPDGIHWDLAPEGATAFGIVSQIDHDDAYVMPGRTVWERPLYLVKATARGSSRVVVSQGAHRIYELLQDAPLEAEGYTLMLAHRIKRVPAYIEVDEETDQRWAHCGGHYELMVCSHTGV